MVLVITKVLCYHQVYVADDLYQIYGDSFAFVQMREPLDWRVKNKQEGFDRPYLIRYQKEPKTVIDLIKKADVIIFGEAPLKLIKNRKKDCLLFKMSENIFKDTLSKITLLGKIKRWVSYKYLNVLTNNSHSYLLACGGFAYKDYLTMNVFKDRALKWGYFPFLPKNDINKIHAKFTQIKTIEMVWISRLIKCKSPLYLIELVKYLLKQNITDFHLTVIGDSDESDIDYFSIMKTMIEKEKISNFISMIGKVEADLVFDFYNKSHIALFTGDKSEGWSVGVSEAMSCDCAVISSNTVGAAPFLINYDNGLIFQHDSLENFCKQVEYLVKNKDMIGEIAKKGFFTIKQKWNHEIAAKHLSFVINGYLGNKLINPCEYGPCSKAIKIDYDWSTKDE